LCLYSTPLAPKHLRVVVYHEQNVPSGGRHQGRADSTDKREELNKAQLTQQILYLKGQSKLDCNIVLPTHRAELGEKSADLKEQVCQALAKFDRTSKLTGNA
jgi:hypothetical protein